MKGSTEDGLAEILGQPRVSLVIGLGPDDVPHILNMASETGIFTVEELLTAEELAWECAFQDSEGKTGIIQARINDENGERPVAFVCFGPIPHWLENYELYFIVVDEKYREQGIGTSLLYEMKACVRDAGGHRIYLEIGSGPSFENARRFYEARRFTIESRFCKQFIPGKGSVNYSKLLYDDALSLNIRE